MNKNKKLTQTMALAVTGIMIANAGMGSVYAADQNTSVEKETESTTEAVTEKETEAETETEKKETSKEETVYVQASPSGETQEIIVSDWLKNTDGSSSLTDKSDLADIKNVKGDETFSQDGDSITWDANGNDIYYQGTSTKELPVSLKVTYYLDGQEISPEDLAGKSGHVKMVYQYTNNMKQGEIYTPFVLFTGMILPGDNFSNVKVDNGKSISDGDKNIVIGVGLPGLEDSLKIKDSDVLDDLDIDLDIPDSFEVEADVTDFQLSMSMTVATPLSLDDLDLDNIDDEDDLKDKIDEIADAATQLVDGTSDLADGVQELKDGCGDLIDGIDQLDDGAGQLNDGVQTLNNKKGDLIDGINQLSDGLNQLNSKKGDLVNGVNQLADGASSLDTGAAALKTGMDQLAAGVTTLDQNRPALMSGLQQLMSGVSQMEAKKEALTGGAKKLAENLTKLIQGTKPGFEEVVNGLSKLSDNLHEQLDDNGMLTQYVNGVNAYVDAANNLVGTSMPSTKPTDPAVPESVKEQTIDVQVDVSFADTNADAIASLQASIDGNKAVLASLQDVKNQMKSVPDELVKKFSSAYSTYSGQLDNNIAQLQSDIAKQEETLAALQQKQTVNTTQKVAVQSNDIATYDGESSTPTETVYDKFFESGSNLLEATDQLYNTISVVSQTVDALATGAQKLEVAFYGTGSEKDPETVNLLGQLSAGANALSDGVSALYDGIDALNVGFNTLALKLPALNDGIQSLATGSTQLQAGVNTLKDGTSALATGSKTLQSGAGTLASGVQQLATGGKQLKKGGATLADGVQQLADGSAQLKDGTSQLKDGGKDLDSGVDELLDGANELKDGMEEFDEEAIQKIVDFADEDLQDMIDRLKDIRDAGDAYQLYSSGNENSNGNVKFIIETASIGDDE